MTQSGKIDEGIEKRQGSQDQSAADAAQNTVLCQVSGTETQLGKRDFTGKKQGQQGNGKKRRVDDLRKPVNFPEPKVDNGEHSATVKGQEGRGKF